MSNHPSEPLQSVRRRVREIEAILARSKSDYFNLGIERPMKERAALEAEMAELRLARYDMEDLEAVRASKVRNLRSEILKARLVALGFATLFAECNAAAEAQVPPTEHTEAA